MFLIPRLSLRLFSDISDPDKMWKANVKDVDGDILCVSQFTLLANTTKGNKPDFHRAMVGLHGSLKPFHLTTYLLGNRAIAGLIRYLSEEARPNVSTRESPGYDFRLLQ